MIYIGYYYLMTGYAARKTEDININLKREFFLFIIMDKYWVSNFKAFKKYINFEKYFSCYFVYEIRSLME